MNTVHQSNTYNLRVVDYKTTTYGFIFKVAMLGNEPQQYQFVYAPYGQFPSLLMMDYLISNKRELPSAVVGMIEQAVREDLGSGEFGFVVVGGDRPQLNQGTISEEDSQAYRPIDDNKLKIIRDIYLSDNVLRQLRSTTTLNSRDIALRVSDDNRLFVDFNSQQSERDVANNELSLEANIKSQRTVTHKLFIGGGGQGARIDLHDLTLATNLILGKRAISQISIVMRDVRMSNRILTNPLYLNTAEVRAIRDYTAPLRIEENGIVAGTDRTRERVKTFPATLMLQLMAERAVFQPTRLERLGIARRDSNKATIFERLHMKGRLVARQYPADLFRALLKAERDVKRPLYLQLLKQAIRDFRHDLFVNTDSPRAERVIYRKPPRVVTRYNTILHRLEGLGGRVFDHNLMPITNEYYLGQRDYIQRAYINELRSSGFKHSEHGLYVPRSAVSASRNNESHQAFVLPAKQLQGKKTSKEIYIESVNYRSSRIASKDALIGDGVVSGKGGERPGTLPDDELAGDMIALPKHGSFLEEALLADEQMAPKSGVFEESTLADLLVIPKYGYATESIFGAIERTLSGEIDDTHLFGIVHRILKGTFMEEIFAKFEYDGYLMDETIFGDRWYDNESFLSVLEQFGMMQKSFHAHITDEFLTGVRQRIEALVEYGILVSERGNQNEGIVTFELGEADKPAERDSFIPENPELAEEVFRPAIIQAENPLGYVEANPSFLSEDSPQATKPIDHSSTIADEPVLAFEPQKPAIIEEAPVATEPERPAVIGSDVIAEANPGASVFDDELLAQVPDRDAELEEPLLADLRQKMAFVATGFVFGETPKNRAAYLNELFFLGAEAFGDGLIMEDEFEKLAQLVLRQGIVEDQMFGTEPERASAIVETILLAHIEQLKTGLIGDDMVAHDEPYATNLLDDFVADTQAYPSVLDKELVAQKREHFTQVLTDLVGDKELAEAVLEDYLLADRAGKSSFIEEPILSKEELKKALIDQMSTTAQGLIYDYNDDVLDRPSDVEEWEEGGFGVPEDYDPDDPFNDYFPWVDEQDKLEMFQGHWIPWQVSDEGSGTWQGDNVNLYFESQTDHLDVYGQYWSEFNEEYRYKTIMAVTNPDAEDVGIVFKFLDSKNHYRLTLRPSGSTNAMELVRTVNGGKYYTWSAMSPHGWELNKPYLLEVSVIGNRLKVWVNNRLQYDFTG